jgi:hypothetical protein
MYSPTDLYQVVCPGEVGSGISPASCLAQNVGVREAVWPRNYLDLIAGPIYQDCSIVPTCSYFTPASTSSCAKPNDSFATALSQISGYE